MELLKKRRLHWHTTCSLHVITLAIFGVLPATSSKTPAISCKCYMKESRTMLCLQAKRPNEPKWRHPWSGPPYNFHPIYFYSFTQPPCQCSSHLNAFMKQINTFPSCLRERNVCLLCAEFLTPAELRYRKPVWDTSDLNIKSNIMSGVRPWSQRRIICFAFFFSWLLWSSAVQSLCANNTPRLIKPWHAEKMEQ